MRNRILIFVFALVALLSVQSAKAWSLFEHGAIVYVADQHLTPEAKAKCRYYLKHTLPYYSTWMDLWRGVAKYKDINNPHTIQEAADGGLDWSESNTPPGRVMGHLRNAIEELGNGKYKNLPDSVVRQRIINMLHYIPDMHCPVHVKLNAYPAGSRKIYRNGKKADLHGYWDGISGRMRRGYTFERYAAEVDNVSPKQVKRWQKGTLDDWGKDCIDCAYRADALTPHGTDVGKFTEEQKREVLALADLTAMMAAYRLAHVLNTIFAE